jgi:CheY-like chemotaxis protein
MESIGHLTGGVAHDFNNILQIIGANLERVAQDVRNQPESWERARNALNAVANGARLTGQLLAFARRQPLNPRSTSIGRIVQDMTDLLRRTLGESVEVECIVGGGLWNTLIDPGQIESAILNLAINSRDAMPGGGKLTIEVVNAFLDDAYAAQHLEVVSGQYVMVAISDTGAGMSTDTLARAFEPFFTTKAEGRGTGLGLSQVYGFVKQSGGHTKIYTECGQGTTVKLYLPRTRKPQESAGHIHAEPVRGGSERILIAEDDESVRNAVMDMVSELGYAVLKAENAEQALVVLQSGVAIDLLFTDVIMPGSISTRELARRAEEMQPNIKVLYTSGYTQNAIVHNGKLDDDASLLSKPYRRDDLARKFRSLLDAKNSVAQRGRGEEITPTSQRGKVLVVEDIALIRLTTVDMIEEIGLKTVEASNGEDALSALRKDPDISVLLTDIGLPGMSGQQLIDKALNLRPDLKIIVASGYSSGRETLDPRTVANQLTKPFDIEQLRRALEA